VAGIFTLKKDIDMATKARGDERRGEDGDEGRGDNVTVVQIENSYFEKLKARLSQQPATGTPATAEPEKPKKPGFVIYGDDGRPID
jgi:hypothetical protein